MSLEKLRSYRLVYLATPYSNYPLGHDKAFEDACALAGALVAAGIKIFCPIAHSHPIARHGELDPMSRLWLEVDEPMMEAADVLLIGELDGYDASGGIEFEKDVFSAAGKDRFYIDPVTLEVRQ